MAWNEKVRRVRWHQTMEERFWSKVLKSDGCWLWAIPHKRRYGHFHVNGVNRGAHRVSWEIANKQPVPNGMHVLHRCDNPRCVRPDHLFLGTQIDNQVDCQRKGRRKTTKLTDQQVREIRSLAGKQTARSVAKQFSVSDVTVRGIFKRKIYWYVTDGAA